MRNSKRNMGKNNRKKILFKCILVVALITIIIFGITRMVSNNTVEAGKIINGRVIYSEKIGITTKTEDEYIIEIISIDEERLDNVIITNYDVRKMKAEDERYTLSLENILKDEETSNKEIYNISKAIELGIINKDDNYGMFLAKVTGFKNTKQFIKFCENAFELMDHE